MWGHYGIAREIAALVGRPLKEYAIDKSDYSSLPTLNINVKSNSCNRYSALRIENISKNVSPLEMQIRLYYCGMRGISLLADLTNYIMLELGQPMHSFDGRKVESILVRDVEKDTNFTTLDGVERISVMYWWASLKNYFNAEFKYFFNGLPDGSSSSLTGEQVKAAMNAQIRALTGGDITKEKEVLAMDTWRALTELDAKARDYQELERKYPSKK